MESDPTYNIDISMPKDSFHAWLVINNRIPTKARLLDMGIVESSICIFCDHEVESVDHLFFQCPFSKGIIDKVGRAFKCSTITPNIQQASLWFKGKFKKELRFKSEAMILSHSMFEIWNCRNKSIFAGEAWNQDRSIKRIIDNVKLRMGSFSTRPLHQRDKRWLQSMNIII